MDCESPIASPGTRKGRIPAERLSIVWGNDGSSWSCLMSTGSGGRGIVGGGLRDGPITPKPIISGCHFG